MDDQLCPRVRESGYWRKQRKRRSTTIIAAWSTNTFRSDDFSRCAERTTAVILDTFSLDFPFFVA